MLNYLNGDKKNFLKKLEKILGNRNIRDNKSLLKVNKIIRAMILIFFDFMKIINILVI